MSGVIHSPRFCSTRSCLRGVRYVCARLLKCCVTFSANTLGKFLKTRLADVSGMVSVYREPPTKFRSHYLVTSFLWCLCLMQIQSCSRQQIQTVRSLVVVYRYQCSNIDVFCWINSLLTPHVDWVSKHASRPVESIRYSSWFAQRTRATLLAHLPNNSHLQTECQSEPFGLCMSVNSFTSLLQPMPNALHVNQPM